MFGGKEKQNGKNGKKGGSSSAAGSSGSGLNSLEKSTSIEGNVQADGDFRMEGELIGDLVCKAKVIIGSSGSINGNVSCRTALVEGKFNGTLHVRELLELRQNASVEGEVSYGSIKIEPGAVIQGSITKISAADKSAAGVSSNKSTRDKVPA